MNKSDLVDKVAERTGQSKKSVTEVIDSTLDEIKNVVAKGDDKLTIQGYLSFEKVNTKARKGFNPQTREEKMIPAGTKTKVTVLSKLKEAGKS